jgi:hypothetical protein
VCEWSARAQAAKRWRIETARKSHGGKGEGLRHAALAAVYLGLAYAAKLAFGVSLTFHAMR